MEGPLKKQKAKRSCSNEGCLKNPVSGYKECLDHGGGYKCLEQGCTNQAVNKLKCIRHGGRSKCDFPGCNTAASHKTTKCIKHGGGLRCSVDGCPSAATNKKIGKCNKHGGGKKCVVEFCTTGAASKSDRCVLHGGGVRCLVNGCKNGARWKSDVCIKHGLERKYCIVDGCSKIATKDNKCDEHNIIKLCEVEGCWNKAKKNTKCRLHLFGEMNCNVIGCNKKALVWKKGTCYFHSGYRKLCNADGCEKFAFSKKYDKCIAHGGGPRCMQDGCLTGAFGSSNYCSIHGGGKKCSYDGCTKNKLSGSDRCNTHGGAKKCTVLGCIRQQQKGGKCSAHGGGNRCINCIDWIDGRCGTKKYDYYCATCFKRLFPNDPRSLVIHEKSKEIQVRNFINSQFEGFVHDKPIYTANCNCDHRRRIDHRKLINNTILAIETDEFAHKYYDKTDEEIRYDDLYMIHSGKWIFIRFNPDGDKHVDFEDKLEILYNHMTEQIERIENNENEELVEIIKLFY